MEVLFSDSTFWVLLSTLCCLFVLVKYGWSVVVNSLDQRSQKIKKNLEEAEKLKTEAQEVLAQYQRKHRDAMKEADAIIIEMQQRVEQERYKAQEQLAQIIKFHETQAKQRIERIEEESIAEIRAKIVDLALEKAQKKLEAANLDKVSTDEAIKRTVSEIKKTVH